MVSQGLRVEISFDNMREKEDPNLRCQLVLILHFHAHWYHNDYRRLQLYVVTTPSSNACPFPNYPKTDSLNFLAYLQDREAFPSIREFIFLNFLLSV